MDRYEAEALLADKPEGSFLLRDSAQENYVFSVSFRFLVILLPLLPSQNDSATFGHCFVLLRFN